MWDDSVSVELTGEKTRTEFRERLDYCSPRGSVEKPSRKPHNQLEERDARVASRVDAAWWTAASAAVLVIATTGTVFHWPTKATVAAAVTAAAQASLRLFFFPPFFSFPPFFFSSFPFFLSLLLLLLSLDQITCSIHGYGDRGLRANHSAWVGREAASMSIRSLFRRIDSLRRSENFFG